MAKKMSRHYPAQKQVRLADITAAVAGGRFVQATRLLSNANRRLYRQSYTYPMKIDVDVGSAMATAGVDIYVLRDTWDLHGAYKFAMEHFYNAQKEELQNAGGGNTRWLDFRVLPDFQADELGVSTANPNSASPIMSTTLEDVGEMDFSRVVDASGATRQFGLDNTGDASIFSIVQQWQHKDRVDDSPANASAAMPYSGLVEDLDEANYDILRQDGASPPYDDAASTSLWTKVTTLKQVSPDGVMKLSSGYFDAPLGLVILISSAFTTDVNLQHPLTVSFQSGDYKGIKAHRYATPVLTPEKKYEVV